jgi:hypothetical protein
MTEHESAEEVINAFLTESDIDFLRRVQQQINLLLNEQKDEPNLREYLLKGLSCYYCYWNGTKAMIDLVGCPSSPPSFIRLSFRSLNLYPVHL